MKNNIEWLLSKNLVDYETAVATMEQRISDIYNNQKPELIWFLEHPPLYTKGTSANDTDLIDKDLLPVYKTGRGGQYTYHGPGMRIAYIMLNLRKRGLDDVKKFVCKLEQSVIDTLQHFGVKGERRTGRVGIWVVNKDGSEAKIAAIGIRLRKWISYHGVAININPNLEHFSGIVPCGIKEHGVTSFTKLGKNITMAEFDEVFIEQIKMNLLISKDICQK